MKIICRPLVPLVNLKRELLENPFWLPPLLSAVDSTSDNLSDDLPASIIPNIPKNVAPVTQETLMKTTVDTQPLSKTEVYLEDL